MMSLLVMLAWAQSEPPPCPAGKTTCEPWERQWNSDPIVKPNPFDRFDPKPEQLGPGPHTLVIIGGQEPVRVDYKSGPACQKARDAFLSQFRAQHPNLIASAVTVACIPR